jgi:predicted alpha-1,6-mannanase (GH76 family)
VAPCVREMFVETPSVRRRTLAVPLTQLEIAHAVEEPRRSFEDWHYWVDTGYGF